MGAYTTHQVAEAVGVSDMTLRRWSRRVAGHLSTLATPPAGNTRFYTLKDALVLKQVADLLEQDGASLETVCDRLQTVTLPDGDELTQLLPTRTIASSNQPPPTTERPALVVAGDWPAVQKMAELVASQVTAQIQGVIETRLTRSDEFWRGAAVTLVGVWALLVLVWVGLLLR